MVHHLLANHDLKVGDHAYLKVIVCPYVGPLKERVCEIEAQHLYFTG